MDRMKVGAALLLIGTLIDIGWLIEAFTAGRGFISTYLAQLALLAIFGGTLLRRRKGP